MLYALKVNVLGFIVFGLFKRFISFFRMQNVDFNHMVLSWSQFCKEPLPQRSFTFWEWFYAVMKITREHLKGPWTDG